MPLSQNQTPVNFQSVAAGVVTSPGGQFGERGISQLQGKYYTLARDGRVFLGSTAVAGVAVPASTTTTATFGLWNPAGSGVNIVMVKASLGYVLGATSATAICYVFQANMGSAIGTAAPFSAFTATTPLNALVGSGRTSQVKLTVSSGVMTAAGAIYRYSGMSHGVPITSTAAFAPVMTEDFDGTFIIPPGVFVHQASSTATDNTYGITWMWAELPI